MDAFLSLCLALTGAGGSCRAVVVLVVVLVRMVIGSSFERSGPFAGVAAGLGVHTHGLGRSRRSGRQTVTTTFPRVWPAPT